MWGSKHSALASVCRPTSSVFLNGVGTSGCSREQGPWVLGEQAGESPGNRGQLCDRSAGGSGRRGTQADVASDVLRAKQVTSAQLGAVAGASGLLG